MARGKLITDFERDVIRIGISRGATYGQIAKFLGRTKPAVFNQAKAMREAGTLDNLPFCFVATEIGRQIVDK